MEQKDSTITMISHIEALPDEIDTVKSVLAKMVEPTRKEPGCVRYNMYQNQSNPAIFTFIHEWETEEAMNAHILSGHFNETAGKLKDLMARNPDFGTYTLLL